MSTLRGWKGWKFLPNCREKCGRIQKCLPPSLHWFLDSVFPFPLACFRQVSRKTIDLKDHQTKSTRVLCGLYLPKAGNCWFTSQWQPHHQPEIVSILSSKLIGSFAANNTSSQSINFPAGMLAKSRGPK